MAETLPDIHRALNSHIGAGAALAFAAALSISGLASAAVGALAGQEMMSGFIGYRVPLAARRMLTIGPGIGLVVAGADLTAALVYSQVVLSFCLPFALTPLMIVSRDRAIMGELVIGPAVKWIATTALLIIFAANLFLLVSSVGLA